MDIIKSIEHEQLKSKVPNIKVGDTIRVHQRIKEGNRQRIQVFEGTVIKKQNGGLNETFTVRRISYGVGVEKTFLLHSPLVEKVELVRVGKARRAKLYYLREKLGKSAKTKEDVGANLNREDLVIKEEVPEATEEVVEETVENAVEEPAEAVAETASAEPVETAKEEVVDTVSEKPVETAKEEVVDTVSEKPVETAKEEVVDTVSEEKVETTVEQPVKEDKAEEKEEPKAE